MVKVAIIDDHAVVRMGLKYMLDVHKRDLAFAGDWPKGEGAAEFVAKVEPDVVLLDIRMPDRDGLSALTCRFSAQHPSSWRLPRRPCAAPETFPEAQGRVRRRPTT